MRQHLIIDEMINQHLDDAFNWFELLWRIELIRQTYERLDIMVYP